MSFLKDVSYYYFVLELILNYIVGGIIVGGIIHRLICNSPYSKGHQVISLIGGVGLAPYLNVLLLNYLLWIIPERSDLLYLIVITIFHLALTFVFKKDLQHFISELKASVLSIGKKPLIVGICFGIVFFAGWSFYIYDKPILEHDTLEYAVQGKVFYENKEVKYQDHNFNPANGFYYVGLHGFTFPLLATWERIQNHYLHSGSDLFFRSVNSIYGILSIILLGWLAFKYVNRSLGTIIAIALPLTYGYFETLMKYHIDFYRIFFLQIALLCLFLLIKKPSRALLIVFGVFLGAQANAHSLGALLSFVELGVLFLFFPSGIVQKVKYTSMALALSLASGSLHYIIDIIWGTGWIFQELKFY